jgi:hypothetical protein
LLDFEKYIPKPDFFTNGFDADIRNETSILSISDNTAHNDNTANDDDPFKIIEKSEYENLEYALQILEDLSARMSTSELFI